MRSSFRPHGLNGSPIISYPMWDRKGCNNQLQAPCKKQHRQYKTVLQSGTRRHLGSCASAASRGGMLSGPSGGGNPKPCYNLCRLLLGGGACCPCVLQVAA